jgi:hypothetical protein
VSGLIELAWKIVPPVLSGVGGVAGTIWKVTKNLEDRVRTIERERLPKIEDWVKNHTEKWLEKKYPEDIGALRKLIEDLKKDVNEEFDSLYSELRGRGKERREERRLTSKLTENFLALQARVQNCEEAIKKFNEMFTQHVKGQQEQWQEISRALGHIEGWLRAMSSRRTTSGEFPGPTKR